MAHFTIELNLTQALAEVALVEKIEAKMTKLIEKKTLPNGSLPLNLQQLVPMKESITEEKEDLLHFGQMLNDFYTYHSYESEPLMTVPDAAKPKPVLTKGPKRTKATIMTNNNINVLDPFGRVADERLQYAKHFATSPTLPPQVRQKRQLGALIGGAIMGVVSSIAGSTLFGFYTNDKVNRLASAVNSNSARQKQMIHVLESQSREISVNRKSINDLEEIVNQTISALVDSITIQEMQIASKRAERLLTIIRRNLDTYTRCVNSAVNSHRLCVGLVSLSAAQEALDQIKAAALERSLIPCILDGHHFNQLKTSFYMTDYGIGIVVHVPLISPSQTFSLFRFHPFPIRISNKLTTTIVPEKTLLALSGDRQHYQELSDEDLGLC